MLRGGVNKEKKQSVPRGGVRKSSVSETSALRHEVVLKKKDKRETKCTTRWCKKEKIGRRPIGQYVRDFCSVPRGGVKGKWRNRWRTDKALCRESSPCAARWRERKKKTKTRSGAVCPTSLGFHSSLCPLRWRKKEKTHTEKYSRSPYTLALW